MASTPEELADRSALAAEKSAYWQRVFGQQRTQVETSKLVATVVLALSGSLVGTTMQVQPRLPLDVVACVLVGIGLLGVLSLVLVDRLNEPNVDDLASSTVSDEQKLRDILIAQRTCFENNEKTAAMIRAMMLAATLFSIAGAVAAVASLMEK